MRIVKNSADAYAPVAHRRKATTRTSSTERVTEVQGLRWNSSYILLSVGISFVSCTRPTNLLRKSIQLPGVSYVWGPLEVSKFSGVSFGWLLQLFISILEPVLWGSPKWCRWGPQDLSSIKSLLLLQFFRISKGVATFKKKKLLKSSLKAVQGQASTRYSIASWTRLARSATGTNHIHLKLWAATPTPSEERHKRGYKCL